LPAAFEREFPADFFRGILFRAVLFRATVFRAIFFRAIFFRAIFFRAIVNRPSSGTVGPSLRRNKAPIQFDRHHLTC
jgi:hypothetical protein